MQYDNVFLRKLRILDYSLLLGIARKKNRTKRTIDVENNKSDEERDIQLNLGESSKYRYYLSIIDYFQVYNLKKRLEHTFKSLKSKEMSVIPPKQYADRFYKFVIMNVLGIRK